MEEMIPTNVVWGRHQRETLCADLEDALRLIRRRVEMTGLPEVVALEPLPELFIFEEEQQ